MQLKNLALAFTAFILFTSPALADAQLGAPAPDFTATTVKGEAFKLSDHKGKIVVLEWNNPGCPFVVKHYGSNNMQTLQKAAAEKGVAWVTINSSAAGKEGHQTAEEAIKTFTEAGAAPAVHILDENGAIGKLYGAQVTPHMFVINKDGNVAYMGAIDDNPSPSADVIKDSKNYVTAAIDELVAGKPVSTPVTQPYGCGVKYAADAVAPAPTVDSSPAPEKLGEPTPAETPK